MRIYKDHLEMIKEVERDLWEMGISVHPETMQDKQVAQNADYATKELRAYGFTVTNPKGRIMGMIEHLFGSVYSQVINNYIRTELSDRLSGESVNPGNSWKHRQDIWSEFLHEDGKFSYTYSERISLQLDLILAELIKHPSTRQAIIEIHSNLSHDLKYIGGKARIPCSMYYQFLRRDGGLDLIYTMRSCDFLTHFPIDVALAVMLQNHVANQIDENLGHFTMFIGSLHAYHKDMKLRGIF